MKEWLYHRCELQPSVFQKLPIWQWLLANQLGEFEYNFKWLECFFAKFAIGFSSYIEIFEDTAFGHMTDIPINRNIFRGVMTHIYFSTF